MAINLIHEKNTVCVFSKIKKIRKSIEISFKSDCQASFRQTFFTHFWKTQTNRFVRFLTYGNKSWENDFRGNSLVWDEIPCCCLLLATFLTSLATLHQGRLLLHGRNRLLHVLLSPIICLKQKSTAKVCQMHETGGQKQATARYWRFKRNILQHFRQNFQEVF